MAATSTQWGEVYRGTFPGFAASDVLARTAVALSAGGDWAVVPVTGATPYFTSVLGLARDDIDRGHSVAVFDEPGNIIRVTAGATVSQGQSVGVVTAGATNYAHPVSGLSATQLFFGPVVGASGTGNFAVGDSLELANPGQQFALRVNPRQLSGLV